MAKKQPSLDIVLEQLGLSTSEITVYTTLVSGLYRVRDIIQATNLKRPTVYYALGSLQKRGLVTKTEQDNAPFRLSSFEQLTAMASERLKEAVTLQKQVEAMVPTLSQTQSEPEVRSQVFFYEGYEAVRRVVMSSMYCKEKLMYIIAPTDNFFRQTGGDDFIETFVRERLARKIAVHSLWEQSVSMYTIKDLYPLPSQVRILPKHMRGNFSSTLFIYDDKTVYISSAVQPNCVVIQSLEHTQTMKTLFAGLWEVSKVHPT